MLLELELVLLTYQIFVPGRQVVLKWSYAASTCILVATLCACPSCKTGLSTMSNGDDVICIPDVLGSQFHRSLAVHMASTQHKPSSLHQQTTAVHLLLPVVMESFLQASHLWVCVCGCVCECVCV